MPGRGAARRVVDLAVPHGIEPVMAMSLRSRSRPDRPVTVTGSEVRWAG
jgi:hypothetical protein